MKQGTASSLKENTELLEMSFKRLSNIIFGIIAVARLESSKIRYHKNSHRLQPQIYAMFALPFR
jgi:hypothetical protein